MNRTMHNDDEQTNGTAAMSPAFIVGMPRAATRWLCKCLNEHPKIAAFGETLYWGRRFVQPDADGRYTPEQLRRVLNHLRDGFSVTRYSNDDPGSLRHVRDATFSDLLDRAFPDMTERLTPGEVFQRITRAIGDAEGVPIVVEKTPHHLNWIDRITSELPAAKFIIMAREPYSFMLSYKHQGDRKSEPVRRGFQRRYHPLVATVVWRGSMLAAIAARERLPDQTHLFSHEDLRTRPAEALAGVQEFLGVDVQPLADRVPQDNTSFPKGQRPELAADDMFWMNLIAGRLIRKAGYERRPTPFEPWPILRSFLTLPVWVFRNTLSMKRHVDGSIVAYLWRWVRPNRSDRRSKCDHAPLAGDKHV